MLANLRLDDFIATCRGQLAGEVRTDPFTRALYSTDASLYQMMPYAVMIPRSADDVVATVSLAAAHELPVLARAAGTSLAGQAVNEAVVIDFSRHLDAILEINSEEGWARVQPGVVLDDLNRALRPHRLQFGPDPASSNRSTIGGAVANNATGSHSLLYGMSADHVRAVEVVLSDGTVAQFGAGLAPFGTSQIRITNWLDELRSSAAAQAAIHEGTPRYWRRCGGYNLDRLIDTPHPNLAQLISGSEGTLAVMTSITVGLVPLPAATGLALLHFDDLYAALEAVPAILETGPSAVELLDNLSLALCWGVPEYARLLGSVIDDRPHCLLVVEYQGEAEAAVAGGIARLRRRVTQEPLGVTGLTPALTPTAQSAVWQVRKVGLGLLMSMRGDMKPVPFIEDAAVPVEHLPAYVRRIEEFCAGLATPISYYAHAGAGCLHIRPLINRRSAAEVARMPDIARFAAELARGYGGALSSEHGDGRTRSWLNEAFYGPALYALFRETKRVFDPHNLLNPGIIVDARPMTEGLRRLPSPVGRPLTDFTDYEIDQTLGFRITNEENPITSTQIASQTDGFVAAVEMCNGAGICRQRLSGTMCPSFMVTREEAHSPRGRANALRAVMTGMLPPEEMTGPGMQAIMDLCVGCKACKAECPSAVDVARLKGEFLARVYADHGVPWRARFFGHSATLNRLGSGALAPATNALLHSRPGRSILGRAVGLARQRPLPPLATTSFSAWWRRRGGATGPGTEGDVALLIDPFTNYNHPEIGVAAVELFERLGLRVAAAVAIDDGRAAISKGLHQAARRAAERTTRTLLSLAGAGLPLVGLEPSSLLTLRDEYYHLLPGDERVPAVARQAVTFEEFMAGLLVEDVRPRFTAAPRRVLLHGHCHQKALVGTEPARRALSLPANYTVEEVDSGCCGMAGSFGYEAEHYDISRQMAERRLLPAVRAAAPETIIAAAGVSCREQIAHFGGRVAHHPAEILRDALETGD